MPIDLPSIQVAGAIAVSAVTILGVVFGWFGKCWKWASGLFKRSSNSGTIEIPKRTMILIPVSRKNALWWHMGSAGTEPGMQIVGDLNITNVSKYGVFVMGAKLRKPKAAGHAIVREQTSSMYGFNHVIPEGAISDLRFDFFVQPPVCEPGKPFTADVAILDQFGNEHWLKRLEFMYA